MVPADCLWCVSRFIYVGLKLSNHRSLEMRRQAVIGGSDLYTTATEMNNGFWGHELMDPDT